MLASLCSVDLLDFLSGKEVASAQVGILKRRPRAAQSPSTNQLLGHHSLGNSTKAGARVGESMTTWRYTVSASLSDALKPLIAAAPSAERVTAKDAGSLLVSSNNSAMEVPILVRTLDP